jgi:hypothetical protein
MYKKLHHFSLAIAAVCASTQLFAQVSAYTVAATAGTYTPITGGTVLYSGTFDDGLSTAITIPSFSYNCTPYTSLKVNANGHIALGTYTSSTNYTPLSGVVNASGGLVSAMGRDLASATTGAPEIRYELVGNEFVVQWKDVRRSGTPSEVLNFQIRLNTSNNTIKFVYGSCTPGTNTIYPEIGLKGVNNTFATNIKNITLACGASGWLGATAGTANNSTVCLSAATLPASGTTFTWSAPGGPATPGAISGTATQCPGSANLSYSITSVSGASGYGWTVPTGWTILSGQGTNSITVTAGTAGQNGNISVTAANTCGSSAASNLAVTVGNAAPQNPGNVTGSLTTCPGTSALTYSVGNAANATGYTWTVPSGWTITSGTGTNSITVTAGTAGQNGTISVTADNACGSSTASTLAVSVDNGTPATPTSIAGTASFCEATGAQTYSVTTDPTATTYTWSVPTGWSITAGANTNSITVTTGAVGQNGNITVNLGNTCGTSGITTLAVSNNPNPTVDAGNDTTVCSNHFPLTLTATGTGSAYSWSNGSVTAATTVTAGGTYTVTATLNGCTAQDAITVVEDPCLGVEEPSLISRVYPNPSNAQVTIELQQKEELPYTVFSADGKRTASGTIKNGKAQLDVSSFAPGKYMVRVLQYSTSFEVMH